MFFLIFIFFFNFIFSAGLFENSDHSTPEILSDLLNDNLNKGQCTKTYELYEYNKNSPFINNNNTIKSMYYLSVNIFNENNELLKDMNDKYNTFKKILLPNIFEKFEIIKKDKDKFFYDINGDYNLNRINLLFLTLSKDQKFLDNIKNESIEFNVNSMDFISDSYIRNNYNLEKTISNVKLNNKIIPFIDIYKIKKIIQEYEEFNKKLIPVKDFNPAPFKNYFFFIFPWTFVQYAKNKNIKEKLNENLIEKNNEKLKILLKNMTICHENEFNNFFTNIKSFGNSEKMFIINHDQDVIKKTTKDLNITYIYFIEKFMNLHLKNLKNREFIDFNITNEINKIIENILNLIK